MKMKGSADKVVVYEKEGFLEFGEERFCVARPVQYVCFTDGLLVAVQKAVYSDDGVRQCLVVGGRRFEYLVRQATEVERRYELWGYVEDSDIGASFLARLDVGNGGDVYVGEFDVSRLSVDDLMRLCDACEIVDCATTRAIRRLAR